MFERAFFPGMHKVLHVWLTHKGVIYTEVWEWIEGVKQAHLPPGIEQDPRVQHQLSAAYTAVTNAQNGLPLPAAYPAVATYLDVQTASAAGSMPAATLAQHELDIDRMSIKDFLAQKAEAADLTFVPRAGRAVAGNQVYAVGKLSVLVDKHAGVVKAFLSDRWVPMGMDDLIQEALKKR
jgi:hypothetical protein